MRSRKRFLGRLRALGERHHCAKTAVTARDFMSNGGMSMASEPILTFTGKWFKPLEPRPEDVDIRDIAHALSLICRFTGHVLWPYSVSQHSIAVARLCSKNIAIYGLLHDAAEAYITDVAHPIKSTFHIGERSFAEVEHEIRDVILRALKVPVPDGHDLTWARVQKIDKAIGVSESIQLMPHRLKWGRNCRVEPAPYKVEQWDWHDAELVFLKEFKELMNANRDQ